MRMKLILKGAPLVQDVVITGHDRDYVGALIFPVVSACRELAVGLAPEAALDEVLAHPKVREHFQSILDELAAGNTGSSTRIARALLLEAPPSIDVGEITDKGSINQRSVLAHRAALVESLYDDPPGPGIIVAA